MPVENRSLHIVHVVESFGGGVIAFVQQLCRLLPGHTHTVLHAIREGEVDYAVTRANFPAATRFTVWQHARREIAPSSDLRALMSLQRELKALQPDVVHLHSSKAGFLGRIACSLLGIEAVVYTPGGVAMLRQDISSGLRAMYGGLERVANRFGGQVVACGPGEAEALARYGVAAKVIANGTEPGPAPMPRTAPTDRPLTVVTIGRATVQKDPGRFRRLAEEVAGDGRFRFVWIGAGELESELPAASVELTGWIGKDEVARRLGEADLYLSTAVWEGLSLAVLEAMAAGLPLLLSACPGNTDVVEPGINGYLFHTDEEALIALRALARNPDLLLQLGQQSRRILEQEHDVAQVARKYEELYMNLARVRTEKV